MGFRFWVLNFVFVCIVFCDLGVGFRVLEFECWGSGFWSRIFVIQFNKQQQREIGWGGTPPTPGQGMSSGSRAPSPEGHVAASPSG